MEHTVAQKLEALLKLQKIDSELDAITKLRGDLPDEVQDLEDDIARLDTRLRKFENEIRDNENIISKAKERKKEADRLIAKYKDQQMNVRNNREYEALSKEVELEELDIQLSDKNIRTSTEKIEEINESVKTTQEEAEILNKELETKRKELEVLLSESSTDEDKLNKSRERQSKHIESKLLRSYQKIRENAVNGLAVVMVKRGACGGCFNLVPPQRQAEIKEQKKLIVCEHCGRVLAGVEEIEVVEEPKKKKTTRKKKTTTTRKKTTTARKKKEKE